MRKFLYRQLADDLALQIKRGVYRAGEKIPSIRILKTERGVSLATVTHALAELENRGLIESRPRSGYVVAFPSAKLPYPDLKSHRMRPRKVPVPHLADDFVTDAANQRLVPLGGAVLSPSLLPLKHLARLIRTVSTKREQILASYGSPAGASELRREIAKRHLRLGVPIDPEDIVITTGCMDAIRLALLAVTKPGDIIALESPTFFGFLQLIRDLGLLALEVPTDPQHGIDLTSLKQAFHKHSVKALIVTPNFQNPTGAAMSLENKQNLVDLARRYKVTLIEDDVYGDLQFGPKRPVSLASLAANQVIYCNSFSKTLTPGLRIGWVTSPLHMDRLRRLKLSGTIASPLLNQLVIAHFLQAGSYERHLRHLRGALESQLESISRALSVHLPQSAQITSPLGGFLIWVKLPNPIDTLALHQDMKRKNISILPGALCATDAKYRRYLRISCGYPWSPKLEAAIRTLGKTVQRHLRA